MAKTFQNAPRPQRPSPEALAVFESGGVGHDTRNHIPSIVEMRPQEPPEPKPQPEEMKRLSIDLPKSLHRRFRTACSAADLTMVGEVLGFIERRTAELEGQSKP